MSGDARSFAKRQVGLRDAQILARHADPRTTAPLELPDFATDAFAGGMAITFGAAELQRLASKTKPLDLQPAGMDDLAYFMNRSPEYGASIERIYFSIAPVAIHGILDTIRTNLVTLVAEIRSTGVGSNGVPSPAVAD